jgi:serine/threonine protein kinase
VWLAEQTEPVRRQVALKLIKFGMYDEGVLKRFQAERQSLAMMDHPAIAKVFDAGSTPDGQPYFVMEYVPGLPITEYCDQKQMSIRERLDLFIKVCDGVQHAHLKAIIHRDLGGKRGQPDLRDFSNQNRVNWTRSFAVMVIPVFCSSSFLGRPRFHCRPN